MPQVPRGFRAHVKGLMEMTDRLGEMDMNDDEAYSAAFLRLRDRLNLYTRRVERHTRIHRVKDKDLGRAVLLVNTRIAETLDHMLDCMKFKVNSSLSF